MPQVVQSLLQQVPFWARARAGTTPAPRPTATSAPSLRKNPRRLDDAPSGSTLRVSFTRRSPFCRNAFTLGRVLGLKHLLSPASRQRAADRELSALSPP